MKTINDEIFECYRVNKNGQKVYDNKIVELENFYESKIAKAENDAERKYFSKMKKMAIHTAEKNSYAKSEIQNELIRLYARINFLNLLDVIKEFETRYNQIEFGCYLK